MYNQSAVKPMMRVRNRSVGDVIPIPIPIFIAIFQMILYLAIVGLEAASVYYDPGRGTIYAGFWCSIFFFITWIAMFFYACFKKSSCCGIYLLIQNILSAIFAIILIVFTALFINDPCLCFNILCKIPNWDHVSAYYSYSRYACTPRTNEKLPILKGLVACAALMLSLNLFFIAVYTIGYIKLRNKSAVPHQIPQSRIESYQSVDQYQLPYLAPTISEPHYYAPTVDSATESEIPSAPIEIRSVKF